MQSSQNTTQETIDPGSKVPETVVAPRSKAPWSAWAPRIVVAPGMNSPFQLIPALSRTPRTPRIVPLRTKRPPPSPKSKAEQFRASRTWQEVLAYRKRVEQRLEEEISQPAPTVPQDLPFLRFVYFNAEILPVSIGLSFAFDHHLLQLGQTPTANNNTVELISKF
ncbi:hypothetical protein OCU04_000209 [Sclerotinia nivalis]|uniref:Uncharacterized protein n=1 Tax=Sclerotinia nivalis TaxID=352851 RepID=A0A9X0AZ10_9HELO|nr:hypothetical protein OCU04_000209 [Sclerotinia nivalis]